MPQEYSFRVGGTLGSNDPSYVERLADYELYEALKKGEYCSLFNSRQMGKSSLETRVRNKLKEKDFAGCLIDMSVCCSNITQHDFYYFIIGKMLRGFNLHTDFDLKLWFKHNDKLDYSERLINFFENILLAKINKKILISFDEIDSLFSFSFPTDDFFATIRFCYNNRANNPDYNRLTFCLLGVAAPSDLIQNRTRTSYNIGKAIELNGFTFKESKKGLLQGLKNIVNNPKKVLQDILQWTGGQPFLTQKICKLVVQQNKKNPHIDQLIQTQIIENWEFTDYPQHLIYIKDRILSNHLLMKKMLNIYQRILQGEDINVDNSYEQRQLLLSGLVVKCQNKLKVYNSIYREIFNEDWVRIQLETVWDAENLRRELSELGIQLRNQGHKLQGNEALRLASLSIEFENPKIEKAILLSNISLAYLELEEFEQATAKIKLTLEDLVNNNNNYINASSQELQIQVHVYHTQGNLYKKQDYTEDALQAYLKAFTILKTSQKRGIDILNQDILSLEIVESIHKNLIELLNHRQDTDFDFTTDDIKRSLLKYLFIYYTPIQDLLEAQKWREADEETYYMISQKVGKKGRQTLVRDDYKSFPLEDLYVLNNLWEKSSKKKFGFRRQKDIWLRCDGKIGEEKFVPLIKFWQAVNWLSQDELSEIKLKEINYQFLLEEATDAYLPATVLLRFQEISLLSRFAECDIAFFDSLMSE